MKDQKARIEDPLPLKWRRADMINRLVHTSIGIQIRTEFHTDGLAPRNNSQTLPFSRKVLRTIESHMLQEMRQTTLTRLFLYGAHLLSDVEISQSRLFCIVANIIGQSVFQLSFAHCRILRQCSLSSHRQSHTRQDK